MTKVTFADDDPAELVAVTEKAAESKFIAGVPLITQVELSIDSPAGKEVEVVQDEIPAPHSINAVGDIDISTPTTPLVPVAPA